MRVFQIFLLAFFMHWTDVVQSQCTPSGVVPSSYQTVYQNYNSNASDLLTQLEGGNYYIRGEDNGSTFLKIIDDSDGQEIFSSSLNFNLPADELAAVDILISAIAAQEYFCDPTAGWAQPYIEDDNAFINAPSLPAFGGGAYYSYAADGGAHFPTDAISSVRPDVIVHEFGHRYVNDNYPYFQNNGGFDSQALGEAVPDILGIAVETEITDETNIWAMGEVRDLSTPPVLYNDPQYQNTGLHQRGLTLGHWFYLMIEESGCFSGSDSQKIRQGLDFLLSCMLSTTPSGMPVVDFATLREATVGAMYNANCTLCYEETINNWNNVGVGAPFNSYFAPPTEVDISTGACSVTISWEDQGVPNYDWSLAGTLLNGTTHAEEGTLTLENKTMFMKNNLEPGSYTVTFEPDCIPGTGYQVTPQNFSHNFTIANQFTPPGIFPEDVVATSCDIVVRAPNIGLDESAYTITLNGQLMTNDDHNLMAIYTSESLFFHMDPLDIETGIEEGMQLDITIDDSFCGIDEEYSIVIQDTGNFIEFELNNTSEPNPTLVSKCSVQPGVDKDFSSGFLLSTRVLRVDPSVLSSTTAGTTFPFEDFVRQFRSAQPSERSMQQQQGPSVPIASLPFSQSGGQQYFLVNLSEEPRLRNPLHPNSPDINCVFRFQSDWMLVVKSIPGNCSSDYSPVNFNYCVNGSLLNLDFSATDLSNISHIEYRYRLPSTGEWSKCYRTLASEVEVRVSNSDITNGSSCPYNPEVQARGVCSCVPCNSTSGNAVCGEACGLDNWQDASQQAPDNPCGPPSLISTFRCGDEVALNYRRVPGVYGYKFYWRELSPGESPEEEPFLWCLGQEECYEGEVVRAYDNAMTPITYSIDPYTGWTAYFDGFDATKNYRFQIESACCNSTASCRLTIDIPKSCSSPTNLQVQSTTSTTAGLQWIDNVTGDTDYKIIATPVNSCLGSKTIEEFANFPQTNSLFFNHTIAGLIPNQQYHFHIEKYCPTGFNSCSTQSAVATAITQPYVKQYGGACTGEDIFSIIVDGVYPHLYDITVGGTLGTWDGTKLSFDLTANGSTYPISIDGCGIVDWTDPINAGSTVNCVANPFEGDCNYLEIDISGSNCPVTHVDWYNSAGQIIGTGSPLPTPAIDGPYTYIAWVDGCALQESQPNYVNCSSSLTCNDCSQDGYLIDTDRNPTHSYWQAENPSMGIDGKDICIVGSADFVINDVWHLNPANTHHFYSSGAGIRVDGVFTVKNAEFNSCDGQPWPGIFGTGKMTILENTKILNAITGIKAQAGSILDVIYTTFTNCGVGLEVLTQTTQSLASNTFNQCATAIKAQVGLFQYPTQAGQFKVMPSTDTNIFGKNGSIGFDLQCNEVNLAGTTMFNGFIGIHDQSQNFTGENLNINGSFIGVYHGVNYFTAATMPNAKFSLSNSEINNVSSQGIYVYSSNEVLIENVNFTSVSGPIAISGRGNTYSFSDGIKECEFIGCSGNGSSSMVSAWSAHQLPVIDNVVTGSNGTELIMFDFQNCINPIVSDNNIGLSNSQVGLYFSGGVHADLLDNDIIGGGNDAIYLDGHAKSYVCDNTIDGATNGVRFDNSAEAYVAVNQFSNSDYAINIELAAIGEQPHRGNCFDDQSDAKNFDPSSSRFAYNDFNNPNNCELHPSSNPSWFYQDNFGQTLTSCNGGGTTTTGTGNNDDWCLGPCGQYYGPCCNYYRLPPCEVFIDLHGGMPTSAAEKDALLSRINDWWAQFLIANCIPYHPLPDDLIDCIIIVEGENLVEDGRGSIVVAAVAEGELTAMLTQAEQLSPDKQLEYETVTSEISSLLNNLNSIDGEANPNRRRGVINQLEEAYDELNAIIDNQEVERVELTSQVLSAVNTLPTPYGFMTHQRDMIEIRAKVIQRGNSSALKESDWHKVVFVANSCPLEIGQYVYYARNLLYSIGGPHPISYDENCAPEVKNRHSESTSEFDSEYSIYPNPFFTSLTISSDTGMQIEELLISDLVGNDVKKLTTINGKSEITIDVSEIPSGIYFITILDINGVSSVHEVVKIN